METRVIIDEPARGGWNMAVDEALLQTAADGDRACLRFYRWIEPTVSLGYFQPYVRRQHHQPSFACPLVRRSTGGGAIVHDHEITYSFTAPIRDRISARLQALYDAFHETLVEIFAHWGISAELCVPSDRQPIDDPFLCFQRRAAGDVLIRGVKVAGSAQRRRHRAILQHGSVLLRNSRFTPELSGIYELTGTQIEQGKLISAWLERLSSKLGLRADLGELESAEIELATQLDREKFRCSAWTHRR
jgi:lipoate-protein ligase A